jgi:hypothetical protein
MSQFTYKGRKYRVLEFTPPVPAFGESSKSEVKRMPPSPSLWLECDGKLIDTFCIKIGKPYQAMHLNKWNRWAKAHDGLLEERPLWKRLHATCGKHGHETVDREMVSELRETNTLG